MTNRAVYSGKVRSVKFFDGDGDSSKARLNVSMSVYTGGKKKDGEQYNPSFMVQFPIWGNYAVAMSAFVEEGKFIIADGISDVPNTYLDKEGNPKASYQMREVKIDLPPKPIEEETAEAEAEPVAKVAKSKAKKADFENDPEVDEVPF